MTMPREIVERIDELAKEEVRPRTQMIRKLLLRALAQNEKTA